MDKLMIDISRCEEIKKAIEDDKHQCHKIVMFQEKEFKNLQLPEPWNGDIEKADILFIGSNPSYNPNEEYPTDSWNDNEIFEYHKNRFFSDFYQDNKNKVLYWQKMRKITNWLLDIPLDAPELENHICLTEIVHCKSKKEKGFSKACDICINKWMEKVLKKYKGKWIVVLGKRANEVFKNYKSNYPEIEADKIIIPAPHPGRWRYLGTDESIRKEYFNKK